MTQYLLPITFLTTCFLAGADQAKASKVRAASIRGQLRWWFRVLGGLGAGFPEEREVFGNVEEQRCRGGLLTVRVLEETLVHHRYHGDMLGEGKQAYLLKNSFQGGKTRFPIAPDSRFTLQLVWKGEGEAFPFEIKALVSVWVHLGALGMRSRRGYGAITATTPQSVMPLEMAKTVFAHPNGICVKKLEIPCVDTSEALAGLGTWLHGWRNHGITDHYSTGPGFAFARRDHHEGLHAVGIPVPKSDPSPCGKSGTTFRPALGLPIFQKFSGGGPTVKWEMPGPKGSRFASPVLLRPHKLPDGTIVPLVIFVEARKWNTTNQVMVGRMRKDVSLDLYEAMKTSPLSNVAPFPYW
jgi:CRISPR-associated protein Cmr1